MKTLSKLIEARKLFFITWLNFVLTIAITLLSLSKIESHMAINQWTSDSLDLIFYLGTYLGDGITVAILGLVFLSIQIRKGIFFILSGALSGMIAQLLKRNVFHDHYRPYKYFELNAPELKLRLLEYVDIHSNFSFPSGHTTAIFAMMMASALILKNKAMDFVLAIIAVFVAFTRVYISQHFLEDILAGSFVGIFVTITLYLFIYQPKYDQVSWLNKKVIPYKEKA